MSRKTTQPVAPALPELTPQAAELAVDESARRLGLTMVRANHVSFAVTAAKKQLTHTGFLAELLAVEVDDRYSRRIARRIHAAKS